MPSLVGSEMCIRDRVFLRKHSGDIYLAIHASPRAPRRAAPPSRRGARRGRNENKWGLSRNCTTRPHQANPNRLKIIMRDERVYLRKHSGDIYLAIHASPRAPRRAAPPSRRGARRGRNENEWGLYRNCTTRPHQANPNRLKIIDQDERVYLHKHSGDIYLAIHASPRAPRRAARRGKKNGVLSTRAAW